MSAPERNISETVKLSNYKESRRDTGPLTPSPLCRARASPLATDPAWRPPLTVPPQANDSY